MLQRVHKKEEPARVQRLAKKLRRSAVGPKHHTNVDQKEVCICQALQADLLGLLAIGAGMALHVGRLGRRLGGDANDQEKAGSGHDERHHLAVMCFHSLYGQSLKEPCLSRGHRAEHQHHLPCGKLSLLPGQGILRETVEESPKLARRRPQG